MKFQLQPLKLRTLIGEKTDVLLVFVPSDFKPAADTLSGWIDKTVQDGDFQGKLGSLLEIYRPHGLPCTRLMLLSLGQALAADIKENLGTVMTRLKACKPEQITLCFLTSVTPVILRTALSAVSDASYVYTTTKTKAQASSLKRVDVFAPLDQSVRDAFDQAVAAIKGVELAREWGNRPANHATPAQLAQAAKALAKLPKIRCKVLGSKEVVALGMGAFEAVAKGSDEPLRFIELRYQGGVKSDAPVVLIGKGITFDSGGISIKPAAEMDEMKFDMCGAASVLGVFHALGQLRPKINVIGLIPSCENLPSSRSVKPGDVVTSMSGQTIEVLNTDAEGRLILCDALTYAARFNPRAVVDIATLTGACVIALGDVRSGLFSNDETLSAALKQAGDAALDPCWPMPLDDDYAQGLKTSFADVANVAGRPGGAITAAKFLQRFAGQWPWAHLDIAGTAWKSGKAKGATGRPVGLLVAYLMTLADARA
ncbi:MAG: leucyl aminopeptidase [Comamonadaceae bacterium CG1_02_60_18]|nr:MAG: leucyl aminopeptidase [Comamonadaceae bacterium CG1_02_60_18]PIQ51420.1 MAG: leucyl aminopeptidase [Comamonadaceae bacterium CG12_big_fil_rev_8_21_14_0_65_59_15]